MSIKEPLCNIRMIKFLSLGLTSDQEVESCDCVDEETECSDARFQGEERIHQVLSVVGNASEQFAIRVITDRLLAKVVGRLAR